MSHVIASMAAPLPSSGKASPPGATAAATIAPAEAAIENDGEAAAKVNGMLSAAAEPPLAAAGPGADSQPLEMAAKGAEWSVRAPRTAKVLPGELMMRRQVQTGCHLPQRLFHEYEGKRMTRLCTVMDGHLAWQVEMLEMMMRAVQLAHSN